MRTYLIFSLLLLFLASCGSADNPIKAAKAEQTKKLVEEGDYEITFTRAIPMVTNEMTQLANANLLPIDSRAGQINLIGTASYIRKRGDSLEVYLPYYGTRQMGTRMGSTNVAIEFEGIPEKYEVVYNERKSLSEISFNMDEGSEIYSVYITVGGSQRANVRLNSSQRTPIKYTGEISVLK